jgi:hypothetical protein
MTIQVGGNTVIDNSRVFYPFSTVDKQSTNSISGGAIPIDLNSSSVFAVNLNATVTSFTITNTQASGLVNSFVLVLIADGTARSVTWPVSFKWPSGTAPTLTSTLNKKDVFVFFTYDGGTSWQAFTSGQNL